MKNFNPLILCVALSLALAACELPAALPAATPTPVEETPTATLTPTPAATPLPTPVSSFLPAVRIESADRALFNGDWESALREYQKALESGNRADIKAAALLGTGRAWLHMGEYKAAVEALTTLIGDHPDWPQVAAAYFALAQAYEGLFRYSEAAEAYSQYLAARPGVIDSYVNELRGNALTAAGDHLAAIDAYQAALASPRQGETSSLELKIAQAYAYLGDHNTAILAYQDVYSRTTNDYTRAAVDYLLGQSYTILGERDKAFAAYLDAVENYPLSYDSYQALIVLVEAGYPVSEFDRGLVDYFAGQYSLAIAAFDRYLENSVENAGTAYYYKGLAYRALNNPAAAIASWEVLIQSYLSNEYWDDAWEQKAYTQWAYLDQYTEAKETLLEFVDDYSWHARAPEFLFNAARIAERAGNFEGAASLWARIPPEYPASELVPRAIFLAGIASYRAENYAAARQMFEWLLTASADPEVKSAAYFWQGKTLRALGDENGAQAAWQQAANQDPTGYYSERARDLLVGRPPFDPPLMFDLGFDLAAERAEAEAWVRVNFSVPETVDLSTPGTLADDPRLVRGTELWNLGLFDLARLEFESLRADLLQSPVDNFRLANYLLELGVYRPAIFAARQVLNLKGMDDAQTLTAPAFFNHVRFGVYYRDLILPLAEAYDFHPLFLFSVVRQESLFEGFVRSSAGARGLMQIMPATGESIVANNGWPPGYSAEDLYRPKVNLTLGTDYLASLRDYFSRDPHDQPGMSLYAALAAYNAGPGNAAIWEELAGGDPDLFLEVIRFRETREYIQGIYEVFSIYRRLYDRTP